MMLRVSFKAIKKNESFNNVKREGGITSFFKKKTTIETFLVKKVFLAIVLDDLEIR